MMPREALKIAQSRLNQFDSLALVGPRQVGKTTLARQLAGEATQAAIYLDLENPRDRRLLDDPSAYFESHASKLIVLDEIHRVPDLFSVLRGQIDERRRNRPSQGKFLLLGSASLALLKQSSESLAGRISYLELTPFNALEGDDLERLWLQGGFPESYSRDPQDVSAQWRRDFLLTYVERDLPQFGLQVNTEQFQRFFRMLANDNGELFNAERFGRSLGINGQTVQRYLNILEQLLLVRPLQPWFVNNGKRLVKSTRPYIRDSGLLHSLMELSTMDALRSHSNCGKSWEGFVIENLCGQLNGRARPYFYRTAAGAECDLLIEFSSSKRWAIEIKLSSAPTMTRGFIQAAQDTQAERRLLIHSGRDTFPMRHGVEAMPLKEAMIEVRNAL